MQGRTPLVPVPTGVGLFPGEVYYVPKKFIERDANLVHWSPQPAGGHFAACEQPELFAEDVRALRPQDPVLMPASRDRFGVVSYVFHAGGLVADLAADVASAALGRGRRHERRAPTSWSASASRDAGRLLADAGVTVSSVMAIGPAVACGDTGSIDAELAVLEAAAAIGAPGVLAFTGPRGDYSAREADARCRAWLERLAPRAVELDLVVMLEPMFPMMRAYSYVHTLSHAFELVADLDGAKVVVDTASPLVGSDGSSSCSTAHVDDVGTVQLTNVSSEALDARRFTRARRSTRARSRSGS